MRHRFYPWSGKVPPAVEQLRRPHTAMNSTPWWLQLEKSPRSNKDPAQPKINKYFLKININFFKKSKTHFNNGWANISLDDNLGHCGFPAFRHRLHQGFGLDHSLPTQLPSPQASDNGLTRIPHTNIISGFPPAALHLSLFSQEIKYWLTIYIYIF